MESEETLEKMRLDFDWCHRVLIAAGFDFVAEKRENNVLNLSYGKKFAYGVAYILVVPGKRSNGEKVTMAMCRVTDLDEKYIVLWQCFMEDLEAHAAATSKMADVFLELASNNKMLVFEDEQRQEETGPTIN